MKWYLLIVVFFSSGYSLQYDPGAPFNHEPELEKYKEKEYKTPARYKDDLEIIDEYYVNSKQEKKNNAESNENKNNINQKLRKYSNEELDKIFGYTGPTANDEPENLMRPCALDDWECIRQFFASNGKCKPAYGPIPDPLYQDVLTIFFFSANVTVSVPNVLVRGLSSAKIREFYFNKKSGNLVFAFDVQNFNVTAPRAYFKYFRTAKEPIVLAGRDTINFRSATFTAVIPKVPDLRLDLSDSFVSIQDPLPTFFLSPELFASPDPDVVTGFASLVGNLPVSISEGVFFEGQLLTALYIQKNICDFGLKLISV